GGDPGARQRLRGRSAGGPGDRSPPAGRKDGGPGRVRDVRGPGVPGRRGDEPGPGILQRGGDRGGRDARPRSGRRGRGVLLVDVPRARAGSHDRRGSDRCQARCHPSGSPRGCLVGSGASRRRTGPAPGQGTLVAASARSGSDGDRLCGCRSGPLAQVAPRWKTVRLTSFGTMASRCLRAAAFLVWALLAGPAAAEGPPTLAHWESSIREQPQVVQGYECLLAHRMTEQQEVLRFLDERLRRDPTDPRPLLFRTVVHYLAGDPVDDRDFERCTRAFAREG